MRVKVLYLTADCEHYLQVREVSRSHLGRDVYQGGTLVCACGYVLLEGIREDRYLARSKEKTR
jgi:hypothetical protein